MGSVTLSAVSKSFRPSAADGLVGRLLPWPRPAASPDGVRAVDNVTMDIADGESVALLGPSGCGKTTLLRLIAGLEAPDSGTISFDGQDVAEVSARDRGIGMVFQNYALYPHMQSYSNLGFFFKMHRREPETEQRVAEVSKIMGPGFRELLDRRPKELSGGQQQRVAVARCIIHEARVLLFDEPLSNLDAQLRAQTRVEIKRLIRRFGVTAFYATHDQTEALAICDRVAVMQMGRLEQFGAYRDLYHRPVNTFIAGFLGYPAMNLLGGIVDAGGVRVRPGVQAVAAAGQPGAPHSGPPQAHPGADHGYSITLPLPAPLASRVAPGTQVTLGLRPEAFRLAEAEEQALDARVAWSEPLAARRRQRVTCTLGAPGAHGTSAGPDDGVEIVAEVDLSERPAPGTPLRLAFDPTQLHVFGPDGRRLEGAP